MDMDGLESDATPPETLDAMRKLLLDAGTKVVEEMKVALQNEQKVDVMLQTLVKELGHRLSKIQNAAG